VAFSSRRTDLAAAHRHRLGEGDEHRVKPGGTVAKIPCGPRRWIAVL
jgi:hypothetical protein